MPNFISKCISEIYLFNFLQKSREIVALSEKRRFPVFFMSGADGSRTRFLFPSVTVFTIPNRFHDKIHDKIYNIFLI